MCKKARIGHALDNDVKHHKRRRDLPILHRAPNQRLTDRSELSMASASKSFKVTPYANFLLFLEGVRNMPHPALKSANIIFTALSIPTKCASLFQKN